MARPILRDRADHLSTTTHPVGTPTTPLEFVTTPTLEAAIVAFLRDRKLRNVSPRTLELYERRGAAWQHWRAEQGYGPRLADVSLEELRSYLSYLMTERPGRRHDREGVAQLGLTPSSVLSVWRFLHACWAFWTTEEMLTDQQLGFFVRGRIPKPKQEKRIRPTYDQDVFSALLAAARAQSDPVCAARDVALLLVLYDTGARANEVATLRDVDIDLEAHEAKVLGKGAKERYVFWNPETTAAIRAYLEVRCGPAQGALFRGHSSRNRTGAMGVDGVRGILKRLARAAEVQLPHGAAVHALRHTFARRYLREGGNVLDLQQLLGHEDLNTTQIYARQDSDGLRQAYRRVMGRRRPPEEPTGVPVEGGRP